MVYRTMVAAALLAVIALPAWAASAVYNIITYGATPDGGGDDTNAIDGAYSAFVSGGGRGVIYIPPGEYYYNGTGILHNPGSTTLAPLYIVGAGPNISQISFAGCSNASCIELDSQAAIGSGYSNGGGISGLTIYVAPTNKKVITVKDLEGFVLRDLKLYGGSTALTISESRSFLVSTIAAGDWHVNGLFIVGETYAGGTYEHLTFVGHAESNDWGVRWDKTSATDAGKVEFNDVNVHTAGEGAFLFQTSSGTPIDIYAFFTDCVGEGSLNNDAWKFKNVGNLKFSNTWGFTTLDFTHAFTFDNVRHVDMHGGTAYAHSTNDYGTSDFQFLNSCEDITIQGVQVTGANIAYLTDETTHTGIHIDNPQAYAATTSNDLSKFQSATQARSAAYRSTTQSISNAAWVSLAFDANAYDYGPVHSTSTNTTRFTAPATGEYHVVGQVTFSADSTGQRGIRIIKNGTVATAYTLVDATGGSHHTYLNASASVEMTAGDYVEIQVYQNRGSSLNTVAATSSDRLTSGSMEVFKAW